MILCIPAAIGCGNEGSLSLAALAADYLRGLWRLDESAWAAPSDVIDESQNAAHGTATNGAAPAAGKYGNGGAFDGTNDHIDLGSALSDMDSDQPFTIMAWVKPNNAAGLRTVISRMANDASFMGWGVFMNSCNVTNCQLFFVLRNTNVAPGNHIQIGTTGERAPVGAWSHIAIVYDGSRTAAGVKLYVNGTLESAPTISTDTLTGSTLTTAPTYIGARRNATSAFFSGSIDEVVVLSRALTGSQVLSASLSTFP